MDNPPQWTNKIPNYVLCDYYYIFFIIFSVWAVLSLLGGIWIYASTKMAIGMFVAFIFNVLISFGIAATSALFMYLICERALKQTETNSSRNQESVSELYDDRML